MVIKEGTMEEPTRTFVVGETISVPWGLDVIEGVVVGGYGRGDAERVIVSVRPSENSDEAGQTITFPKKVLEAAQERAQAHRPGMWANEVLYEHAVASALTNLLRTNVTAPLRVLRHGAQDVEPDLTLGLGDKVLIVEAKNHLQPGIDARLFRQVLGWLTHHEEAADRSNLSAGASGLIVTDSEPTSDVLAEIHDLRTLGHRIAWVRWLDSADNPKLSEALEDLLSSASQ
jgi:hypothetical protein